MQNQNVTIQEDPGLVSLPEEVQRKLRGYIIEEHIDKSSEIITYSRSLAYTST